MAVQLEQDIMKAIGLGAHYNYFNGSGSCQYIRSEAVRRLHQAIKTAHEEGKEIDTPYWPSIEAVGLVSKSEPDQYTLTRTWQACATVIQMHIHGYHMNDDEKTNLYVQVRKDITPEQREPEMDIFGRPINRLPY